MKIVITSGGTAGHINPSLSLAEELIARGHQVIFAGTPNRLESKLVPKAGYEFKAFNAKGFNRNKPWTIFGAWNSILKSTREAKVWLESQNADAVIGFGSYVSIAICRAAKQLGIPYAIHEQNSVMGMANKYLCKNAEVTCLTYGKAASRKCRNVVLTGNPVRKSVIDAKRSDGLKLLDIPENSKVLLVFGGSLGAAHINKAIVNMAEELLERKDLYIVHVTGENQYDNVVEELELSASKQKRYKVFAYQHQMAETMAASDMCISRAGASTIAEITARALPSLLIPYPYATENHQFYNAQFLLNAGCVMYINDDAVLKPQFKDAVIKLVDDAKFREEMKLAYEQFDAKNSAKKLADEVENLAK